MIHGKVSVIMGAGKKSAVAFIECSEAGYLPNMSLYDQTPIDH